MNRRTAKLFLRGARTRAEKNERRAFWRSLSASQRGRLRRHALVEQRKAADARMDFAARDRIERLIAKSGSRITVQASDWLTGG